MTARTRLPVSPASVQIRISWPDSARRRAVAAGLSGRAEQQRYAPHLRSPVAWRYHSLGQARTMGDRVGLRRTCLAISEA